MNRRYRKTIIAGNWKMNNTQAEGRALIEELKTLVVGSNKWCETVVCVPSTCIHMAVKAVRGSKIAVGAQNMHWETSGAYTGEVSAEMIKDLGAKYVILGHSERRQYFNETDENVNKKVLKALEVGIRPIVCVGETLAQREQNITMEVIRAQVKIALAGVSPADIRRVVIAYEPIWAIGTGKTATSEEANNVNGGIRDVLREIYDARTARAITVQYGGSMNASNAKELLGKLDVDGGLIGGASLKPVDFAAIINAANQ